MSQEYRFQPYDLPDGGRSLTYNAPGGETMLAEVHNESGGVIVVSCDSKLTLSEFAELFDTLASPGTGNDKAWILREANDDENDDVYKVELEDEEESALSLGEPSEEHKVIDLLDELRENPDEDGIAFVRLQRGRTVGTWSAGLLEHFTNVTLVQREHEIPVLEAFMEKATPDHLLEIAPRLIRCAQLALADIRGSSDAS